MLCKLLLLLGSIPFGACITAQDVKRPLDIAACDRWCTIEQERLSRDGRWLAYVRDFPSGADGSLILREFDGDARQHVVERGKDPAFDPSSRWGICLLGPLARNDARPRRRSSRRTSSPSPGSQS